MKIYQIMLGECPKYLGSCVESVKDFSKRKDIEYNQISSIPDDVCKVSSFGNSYVDNYFYFRTVSEFIRLKLLSTEKDILVVDWDIFLNDSFDFSKDSSRIIFSNNPMECMIYNSTNNEIFQSIYESVLKNDEYKMAGKLPLINGITKYIKENNLKYFEFDPKSYKHLDNCRLMQ